MCVDASQSTSEDSIMDDPEQLAWDSLAMEVLMLDVWTWLHGNEVLLFNLLNIEKHGVG